ncbi:uncharacterized protein LOC117334699 [Pecten maximus]|uniref:uncharacterized protein LOC117334699 n=1 Tax=Pecten maximus TaxID=6579 RepID=UPI0014585016|nr:uncharacterized protein LOC117334699 [Pecten maximus]XP_033750357.1 uncharacterized protein LOC117334699 [Pecten maximus]XP_033750358.1 uncharacterized protein LOC117334699 [Pecten maximus]
MMRNLFVTFVRRCICRHHEGRLATTYSYSTETSTSSFCEPNTFKQGRYFLKHYTKQPSREERSIRFHRKRITVADVEPYFDSCQSSVEVFKSILDQKQNLSSEQRIALDAIQMNIWNFHVLDLDFDQLLDMIERSIMQNYYSEHLLRALFMRATEKFDIYNWDTTSITRLMLTTTVFRQVPHTLLSKVHTFVCLNIKLFSLKELALIMNAFYVGKFKYGHEDLLASTVIDKSLTNLHDIDSADLFIIVKACQSRVASKAPFLLDMARALTKNEDVLKKHCRNFVDVAYFLKQYAMFKLDVPKFVKAVLKVMPKPTDFTVVPCAQLGKIQLKNTDTKLLIRQKDIGTISWALGCLAYDLNDLTGIHSYLENLFSASYSTHQTDHTYCREFFFGQVVVGRFSPLFIEYMKVHSSKHLKEEFMNQNLWKRKMLSILLRVSMDIECPEVELKKIPQGMLESNMKASAPKSTYQYIQQVTNCVNKMLEGRFTVCHTILPYIPKMLEIRLDNNNRPVSFTPTNYEDLLKEMKNKQVLSRSGRRIAILLRSKSSFLKTAKKHSIYDRPSGFTIVSERQLQKLGYESCLLTSQPESVSDVAENILSKLVHDFGMEVNSAVHIKKT